MNSSRPSHNRSFLGNLFLCLFVLIIVSPVGASPPQYEITATYDEERHQIEGVEKITFTNTGETDLFQIYLFLYPNLYLEKDPKKKSDFYQRAYPVGFNPGSIRILSVRDRDGNDLILTPFFGVNLLTEIRLDKPIPPQSSFDLLIQFVTRIPERYGVFGQFRNEVTLQGGWHPYLPPLINGTWDLHAPPSKSQFHVSLTIPQQFHVVASAPLQQTPLNETQKIVSGEATAISFFSLSLSKDVLRQTKTIDSITVSYMFPKRNKGYETQILNAAEKAVSFFLADWKGASPEIEIQLAQAYLHQALVTPGEKVLYIDSKLFKVLPVLKRFHEVEVARGVFFLLWREVAPWEESWALELLASATVDQFTQTYYPQGLQLKSWLKPIAFLPFVDRILYSDMTLLRQVYFKEWITDNETLRSFNQLRPDGTALGTRLKRRLGSQKMEASLAEYKGAVDNGQQPQLRETLLRLYPIEMTRFFETERAAPPSIDFGIERVEKKRIENGYQTTLHLKKAGEGVEPVEILLREKNGTTTSLLWNGEERQYETTVVTPSPVAVVEVDPKEETSDRRRGNNRDPRAWKTLLNRYGIGYNPNTDFLNYDIGLLFQPVYDATYQIGTEFFHSEQRDMGLVQYKRTLRNKHQLTTGLSYRVPRALTDMTQDEPAGTLHFSYALRYPNIPMITNYIGWLTGQYPNMNISFGYDRGVAGNEADDSLRSVQLDLRRLFPFSNYHEISTRFLTGFSSGELFPQNRFFLGGEDGIRGYTPLRFEGDNISLLSLEYRFPLVYETDINLSGLALTHTLQGAFFSDWGQVADGSEVFNLPEYKSDVGIGIRWFADSFGITPAIFRVDVAWPIDSPIEAEKEAHYYISAGQLF